MEMNYIGIASLVGLCLCALLILVLWKHIHEMLEDKTTIATTAPYSLGRTLLFFWTLIIVFSMCWIGMTTGELPTPSNNVLLLMGIVAGTTTGAGVIDYTQITQGFSRHQNDGRESFLLDILSDANGVCVHRFQLVLFHLIYGCVFIGTAISQHILEDFNTTTLAMLGISSGTYALLKIPENSPNNGSSANSNGGNVSSNTTTIPTSDNVTTTGQPISANTNS